MNINLTMHKNKQKQPPKNFFRYFVDEYILFRRDFVIETTLSIEDCAKSLLALSETNLDDLKRRRLRATYTTVEGLSTIVYFKIIAEQVNSRTYIESADTEGTIEYEDNTTLVRGKVLMSGWQYWGVILWLGFILLLPVILNRIGIVIIFQETYIVALATIVFMVIYSWVLMYRDRNYLVKQIQQAIHNAEMEAKAKNEAVDSEPLIEAQDSSVSSHANES